MKIFKFNILIFLVSALLINTNIFSQETNNATIRGFIYDKESGEPLIYTAVFLKGTTHGTSSDANGLYNISKVPPGKYILCSKVIGYDSLSFEITLKKGEIVNKKLQLSGPTRCGHQS